MPKLHNESPAAQQSTPAKEAAARIRKGSRGGLPPVSVMMKTGLIAAAGALGSQLVSTFWPIVWTHLHPPPKDPYDYLVGRYKGQWDWTDPVTHTPTNTLDIVYFHSITNGELVGSGDDYHLGSYVFGGTVTGNEVTADYTNTPGEGEPAQTGQFYLSTCSTKPIELAGTWNGFFNGKRIIEGTVKLIKDDPTKQK